MSLDTETRAEVPAPSRRRPYLHQVDLIRATTFALVIFTHVLAATTDQWGSHGVNATNLLFHATRNIFFALTGFVLMYQNLDRDDFSAVGFWRRRIKLVIIPYAIWSAIYWMVIGMWSWGRGGEIPSSLDEFWAQLSWGTAAFHLYFLFVMLQVYLLFPLLRMLVARTRGHHGLVLAASLLLQIGIVAAISYWQTPAGWGPWNRAYATFIPYQLFIVGGAVAADHRDAIARALKGRGGWLAGALVATGAFAIGSYFHRVAYHGAPTNDPNGAFEPTLLPFIVTAVISIYAMASHWAANYRAASPRVATAVAYAANRSFPVFLIHVMVMFWILRATTDTGQPVILAYVPQPFGTVVVYLLVVAGSLLATELLRRLPGSLYLTGRPRLPWRFMI